MATPTKYTKSITTDFTSLTEDTPNFTTLTTEIGDSSISIALDYINYSEDDVDIWFKDILVSGEQTVLDTVVSNHTGVLLEEQQITTVSGLVQLTSNVELNNPHTADNVLRVALEKSDTTFSTKYSHNWCDSTSWYEQAVYVVSGVATDQGDHLSYDMPHTGIIDTSHGKISSEDYLTDDDGNSYKIQVWVNDSLKTEDVFCSEIENDYCVNYPSGIITFHDELDPADTVTTSYHYQNGAKYTLKPRSGKQLKLSLVEVQMTEDTDIKDALTFTMYGYVDIFAPQLLTTNGGPYPPGTKIPLANPIVFKTIFDYYNDAVKSYPKYPPLGGSSGRGTDQAIYVLDWDYLSNRVLFASYGMEIRIELQNNIQFGGTYATATFYCMSEYE